MQWSCRLDAVKPGAITKLNDEVILARDGDRIYALGAKCPHAGAELADGAICGGKLVCPWHKAVFELESGKVAEPPALDDLPMFQTRVEGDTIQVDPSPVGSQPRQTKVTSQEPSKADTIYILGTGAAGTAACVALRRNGYAGRILLIGDEADAPYDRTSLSKFVLAGDMAPDEAPPLRDDAYWRGAQVDRLQKSIIGVDAVARKIQLEGGEELIYEKAILALGATARRPSFVKRGAQNVYTLRSRRDASEILSQLRDKTNVAFIGGSFIALEAASALRKKGAAVRIISREAVPFAKQFGDRFGQLFKSLHEDNGVIFRAPAQPVEISNEGQRVKIKLEGGDEETADFVIVATGAAPATDVVSGVEKSKDGAIIVDDRMKGAAGLYAVGDCAAFAWQGVLTRIEHWRTAQQQAEAAASNLTGMDKVYSGVPFFWTYHFGKRFDYLGHNAKWDRIEVFGDPERFSFLCLYLQNGEVTAALACDREKQMALLAERLRDPLPLVEARRLIGP